MILIIRLLSVEANDLKRSNYRFHFTGAHLFLSYHFIFVPCFVAGLSRLQSYCQAKINDYNQYWEYFQILFLTSFTHLYHNTFFCILSKYNQIVLQRKTFRNRLLSKPFQIQSDEWHYLKFFFFLTRTLSFLGRHTVRILT